MAEKEWWRKVRKEASFPRFFLKFPLCILTKENKGLALRSLDRGYFYKKRQGDYIAYNLGGKKKPVRQLTKGREHGTMTPVAIIAAGIAQPVEQLIRNQQVACSSHVSSSNPRQEFLTGILFLPGEVVLRGKSCYNK